MNAVLPILLLILLGYYGRRKGFFHEQTLVEINRFNFKYGYSSMLFINLYNADLSNGLPLRLIGVVMLILTFLALMAWGIAGVLTDKRDRKGVLIQVTFRSNYAIIGMMLAEALAGSEGTAMVAIFQLPSVLFFNVVSVLALSVYSDSEEKPTVGSILRSMALNPMIHGILAGGLALVIRQVIPTGADGLPVFSISGTLPWLYSALTYLSRMAAPLALIVLGANLILSDARGFMKELIGGTFLRLVGAPVVGFLILYLAQKAGIITLTPGLVAMLIALLGSPVATASAIMAREMKADYSLAGQLVVWTSVLSTASLFILVTVLKLMGWL